MSCTSGSEITTGELNDVCSRTNTDERLCSGCGANTIDDLVATWSDKKLDCHGVFSNILYGPEYQPANLRQVNADFYYLMKTQAMDKFGCKFDGTDDNKSCQDFNNMMLKLCRDNDQSRPVPGICDNFLCHSFCPNIDYSELSSSSEKLNWCGCYTLPEDDVSTSLNQNLRNAVTTVCDTSSPTSEVNAVPCYPLCHQISTVQLYQASLGCRYQCNSNICVIDDVTINAFESKVGGVSLTQICPDCSLGGGICECIISSDDMSSAFDDLVIESSFNQYCGSNSVCYSVDDTGNLSPVDCDSFVQSINVTPMSTIIPITLIVILLIAVIIIIIVLYFSRGKTTSTVIRETDKINVNDTNNNESLKNKNRLEDTET